MRHRWYVLIAALGVLLLVTACGGGDPSPAGQDNGGVNESDPAFEEEMELVGLTWTSAIDEGTGEPVDTVESFTTISPAVVAVVEARWVPAGTAFTATWSIDGIDVPEATMNVTVDEDLAVALVAFEFIREEGRYFPLGDLRVIVTTSTGESIDSEVPVQLP